jgi:hypothetical protein
MFNIQGDSADDGSSVNSFNPVCVEDKPKRTKKQAVSNSNRA